MQSITGQYECEHRSGIGLDYFTSRIDRLVFYSDGRFLLTAQKQSRALNAAQAALKGERVSAQAPEVRHEGRYSQRDKTVDLHFDNGGFEQAQLSWNGEGIQIGPNFFKKVADSTMLPPTHRVKKDMEDIAKGVKIASTLGGMAMKAAKTLRGAVQPEQTTSGAPGNATPAPPQPAAPQSASTATAFCERCGTQSRPDKRFCHSCGAPLA